MSVWGPSRPRQHWHLGSSWHAAFVVAHSRFGCVVRGTCMHEDHTGSSMAYK